MDFVYGQKDPVLRRNGLNIRHLEVRCGQFLAQLVPLDCREGLQRWPDSKPGRVIAVDCSRRLQGRNHGTRQEDAANRVQPSLQLLRISSLPLVLEYCDGARIDIGRC